MNADSPPVYNCSFRHPDDMDESQVSAIRAFRGIVPSGNLDGEEFIAVAWKPTPEEIEMLRSGGLVYLTCLGGLPPHFITTDFDQATYGQAKPS